MMKALTMLPKIHMGVNILGSQNRDQNINLKYKYSSMGEIVHPQTKP